MIYFILTKFLSFFILFEPHKRKRIKYLRIELINFFNKFKFKFFFFLKKYVYIFIYI